jgi:hypothetical protein
MRTLKLPFGGLAKRSRRFGKAPFLSTQLTEILVFLLLFYSESPTSAIDAYHILPTNVGIAAVARASRSLVHLGPGASAALGLEVKNNFKLSFPSGDLHPPI